MQAINPVAILILTLLLGSIVLGAVIILQLRELKSQQVSAKQQLDSLELHVFTFAEKNDELKQHINNMAIDFIRKDIYMGTDQNHHQAIEAAGIGQPTEVLINEHGLSTGEAKLLVALHKNNALSQSFSSAV